MNMQLFRSFYTFISIRFGIFQPITKESLSSLRIFFQIVGIVIIFGLLINHYIKDRLIFAMNYTESLDDGFFFLDKKFSREDLKQGAVVGFVFKGPKNRYWKENSLFLKEISCKEGDSLSVTFSKEYFCNGKFIGLAHSKDSKNREVENFKFNGIIPKGKIFLTTQYKWSYDSRYWGFVDINNIEGVAIW